MERAAKHETRRAQLADAILDLASREGIEHVTLRGVAAEAGVSMGQVQHYFTTKEDMLLYAVNHAMRGMERRIHERMEGADWDEFESAERMLRSMLEEMLGMDPETRRLLRVSIALLSRAGADERIAEALVRDDAELMAFTVQTIQWAQQLGRADPSLDPMQDANILWALAGQLGSDVALGRRDGATAASTLHYALGRIFRFGADDSR
ncbi:MAG: TetR family transcriptional regulator [Chloroflexota bacterium]|nr:TetR family transcriptional regulator [Chloroflexota bacterium]